MAAPKMHPGSLGLASGGAMSNPMQQPPSAFVWGSGGKPMSAEQARKHREIEAALMAKGGSPSNLGEGLNRVGEALLAVSYGKKAEQAETEGAAARKAVMDALMGNPDPTMQDIAGAYGNDWVTSDAGSAAMLQALTAAEVQQNDPLRQQQLQMGEIELENARNPKKEPIEVGGVLLDPDTYEPIFDSRSAAGNKPVEVNGQLVDPVTGEVIGDYRDPQAPAKPIEVGGVLVDPTTYQPVFDSRTPGDNGFTLSPGQQRFDAEGNPIAAAPEVADPDKAPTVQKVLLEDGSEMAVQWDGATKSWVPINAPKGGGTLRPGGSLTEGQAKLTLFQSLQTETQPVLLDLESQFNPGNLQDAAARSTPIAGNFFQSEQGQIYSSAATAWAEGALRIATGAAATPEEMERTKKAYFAQPGDTPNTIAFKAQMREMYNRAIQRSLGQETSGALPKPSEFAQQMSASAGGGAAPEQSRPPVITQQDYQALPSGSPFIAADDPTQTIRIKP